MVLHALLDYMRANWDWLPLLLGLHYWVPSGVHMFTASISNKLLLATTEPWGSTYIHAVVLHLDDGDVPLGVYDSEGEARQALSDYASRHGEVRAALHTQLVHFKIEEDKARNRIESKKDGDKN
ncbi:MAG: hypothetical protein EOO40_00890 [Deltaproteobacteria bacterium]|nr:MAG: hypothetical protein EOO40_00890 [Deltaproteobacteria bacterium]